MSKTALTVGDGRAEKVVVFLGNGSAVNLGRPKSRLFGTRLFDRRVRRMIAYRLRNEPEFYEAFGSIYDKKGVLRAGR